VLSVAPASIGAEAGILPGDEIVAVNGEAITDVIRYQVQVEEPEVELDILRGGLDLQVQIAKRAGEQLGIELASSVFDQVRTCDNHCPFCFIYQLPPEMRPSLALKDDDYRLSFLYGNFTTLTRFTEADLERVVTERLSPLFVSIHATDPEVRTQLLRNRRGASSLRWLRALLDHGIEIHGQVVVCPGVNDGEVLDETLLGVLERYPELASIGVVPLGVSAHNREPEMRQHTRAEAEAVVDLVTVWQQRFETILGRTMVYLADEYYLMAERPFPELAHYAVDEQRENGVGMAASFTDEVRRALAGENVEGVGPKSGFFAWVEGAPAEGYRAPRLEATADLTPVTLTRRERQAQPITLITGVYGARVLEPLVEELSAAAGVAVSVLTVENTFFGGNIGVSGLLTGADLTRALADAPSDHRYLLPDVALSNGVFLDDTKPDALPRPVEIIGTDGSSLVAALRAEVRQAVA
jgi:putative radical SAM enzyme (TIGR03279 family)